MCENLLMTPTDNNIELTDDQLLRYSKQIMLPQFGIESQQRLLESHVLLLGLGGLGSPIALYLAAAGIGQITLVDPDVVELSNLQRQIIHQTADIGRRKVDSAEESLHKLNSDTKLTCIPKALSDQELNQQADLADVVVDATDHFQIRDKINQACVNTRTPLVSGAAIRMEGQVSVFRTDLDNTPCYRCLYPELSEDTQTCSENGVLAPVTGIIGSIQALETIKLLTGVGTTLSGRLLMMDASHMEWRDLKLKQDKNCPVCAKS